jgi:hypothetical protein
MVWRLHHRSSPEQRHDHWEEGSCVLIGSLRLSDASSNKRAAEGAGAAELSPHAIERMPHAEQRDDPKYPYRSSPLQGILEPLAPHFALAEILSDLSIGIAGPPRRLDVLSQRPGAFALQPAGVGRGHGG